MLRIASAILALSLLLALCFASRYIIEDATTSNEKLHDAYLSQIHYTYVGFGCLVLFAAIPYNFLIRFAPILYVTSIVLLALCFSPLGREVYHARSWVRMGPLNFEPAEFAKIAYILFLAAYLRWRDFRSKDFSSYVVCLVTAMIPFFLVYKQPALGSALVFLPVCFVILFTSGARLLYLGGTVALIGIFIGSVYYFVVLKDESLPLVKLQKFQVDRIKVFFDSNLDPKGVGYQSNQALIAVGSGGLEGKGWKQGTQSRYGYLPSTTSYNDLIFSVVGEDFGFRGGASLILAECAILIWCLSVAAAARDSAGSLIAVGVATMLFTHIYINIGMNMKLTPITGIPLPFISYGGTFLVTCLAAIGLVFSVLIHRGNTEHGFTLNPNQPLL